MARPAWVEHALPGAVGGVSLVVVGHPFDLVKVRLQTAPYPTLRVCLAGIYRPSGWRGFYQGVTAPLVGVIPIFSLYYGTYRMAQSSLKSSGIDGLKGTGMAAIGAGVLTTLVSCPAERVKILLQVALPYQRATMLSVARQMYGNGGLQSFYRGLSVMLIREVPSSLIYFGVYEGVKARILQAYKESSHARTVAGATLAGGLAGATSWLATAPLDVIKSVYQSDISADPPRPLRIARQVWRASGFRGFYRGMLPAIARSTPSNAACFGAIELVHAAMSCGED